MISVRGNISEKERATGRVISASERNNLLPLSLGEFVQRPAISSQIRGVLPKGALAVVFGPPKGGKTFSVADLAMHAAHGMDWHGCAIPRRLRVVYLAGEGISGLRVRLKAWIEHHDTVSEPGDFRILPHSLSLPDSSLELVEALRSLAPEIIVIDTLNAYFGSGDENSTQDMTAFCNAVRYVRDSLGSSVIVVHHTGHADPGRERGSIVLRAAADVLIQVAKDEKANELVGFQVIAARDMEPMEAAIGLRLMRVDTEWRDEDELPLASCVVCAADQAVTLPGRGQRPLGPAQAGVLQAAKQLARFKVPDERGEVLLARADVTAAVKSDLSRQSVSSAWAPLERLKLLRRVEPGLIAVRMPT